MHNWYTVYNPTTKEAVNMYVVGSAVDGFLAKDRDLIRAFFVKNVGCDLIMNCTDEHLDRIFGEGGTIINSDTESAEFKAQYITQAYE